jgi:hypothetical protein
MFLKPLEKKFHWPHENLFPRNNDPLILSLEWLPMPYQHVSIYNPTLEPKAYLCLQFMSRSHIALEQLTHQNLTQIQPIKVLFRNYFGNVY